MERRFFDTTSALNSIISHDDERAFEYIYNLFYDKILAVAIYYLRSEELAKDLIAEVFCKMWDDRKKLPSIQKLDRYLYKTTKNRCLNYIRDNKKMIFVDDEELPLKLMLQVRDPETDLISKEYVKYINQAINDLPSRCRLIFVMVKEEMMKYKEVAEILDISVKTVENQMTKSIGVIRKAVSDYHQQHRIKNIHEKK